MNIGVFLALKTYGLEKLAEPSRLSHHALHILTPALVQGGIGLGAGSLEGALASAGTNEPEEVVLQRIKDRAYRKGLRGALLGAQMGLGYGIFNDTKLPEHYRELAHPIAASAAGGFYGDTIGSTLGNVVGLLKKETPDERLARADRYGNIGLALGGTAGAGVGGLAGGRRIGLAVGKQQGFNEGVAAGYADAKKRLNFIT